MNKAIKKASRLITIAEKQGYMTLSALKQGIILISLYKDGERLILITLDKDKIQVFKISRTDRDRLLYTEVYKNYREKHMQGVLNEATN